MQCNFCNAANNGRYNILVEKPTFFNVQKELMEYPFTSVPTDARPPFGKFPGDAGVAPPCQDGFLCGDNSYTTRSLHSFTLHSIALPILICTFIIGPNPTDAAAVQTWSDEESRMSELGAAVTHNTEEIQILKNKINNLELLSVSMTLQIKALTASQMQIAAPSSHANA